LEEKVSTAQCPEHLLLQTRTKVLNNQLDEVFRRWYPKFRPVAQPPVPERKAA
jgi:hypothetical protein